MWPGRIGLCGTGLDRGEGPSDKEEKQLCSRLSADAGAAAGQTPGAEFRRSNELEAPSVLRFRQLSPFLTLIRSALVSPH